jgi:hypothetical protein
MRLDPNSTTGFVLIIAMAAAAMAGFLVINQAVSNPHGIRTIVYS